MTDAGDLRRVTRGGTEGVLDGEVGRVLPLLVLLGPEGVVVGGGEGTCALLPTDDECRELAVVRCVNGRIDTARAGDSGLWTGGEDLVAHLDLFDRTGVSVTHQNTRSGGEAVLRCHKAGRQLLSYS